MSPQNMHRRHCGVAGLMIVQFISTHRKKDDSPRLAATEKKSWTGAPFMYLDKKWCSVSIKFFSQNDIKYSSTNSWLAAGQFPLILHHFFILHSTLLAADAMQIFRNMAFQGCKGQRCWRFLHITLSGTAVTAAPGSKSLSSKTETSARFKPWRSLKTRNEFDV